MKSIQSVSEHIISANLYNSVFWVSVYADTYKTVQLIHWHIAYVIMLAVGVFCCSCSWSIHRKMADDSEQCDIGEHGTSCYSVNAYLCNLIAFLYFVMDSLNPMGGRVAPLFIATHLFVHSLVFYKFVTWEQKVIEMYVWWDVSWGTRNW